MSVVHLTDRGLKSLQTTLRQEDFWDQGLPGFGVRVSRQGRRSFVVMYRARGDRRKRRMTVGTYPSLSLAEARDRAKAILYDVARGNDPQSQKKAEKEAHTFAQLGFEYLEKYAKRQKKTWEVDQQMLERDLYPLWGSRKAKEISRRDVVEVFERIVERGAAIQANRTLTVISRIFNFAIDEEIVEVNPVQRITRAKEHKRDRVLSESELALLWSALEVEELLGGSSFKLRLLTAQRGVEILSMRWRDIDGEWWTIPAELSKNGLSHRVPLSREAREVLRHLEARRGESEWVFGNPKKPGIPIKDRMAGNRVRRRVGFAFTPHDLRRTAASHMTSAGVSRLVVSKILNHVETGVTAVYDRHSYDGEKREALSLWGRRLFEIVGARSALS